MLQLQNISILQFRNYTGRTFSFTERVTGICGSNGSGKTNLLDAIYYLSFTKSYLTRPDSQNVHHGLLGMRLEGNYTLNEEKQKLVSILRENNKKEFSVNGDEYKKFSEHIGRFPCVMIAPDDAELITGGSEERRKFVDTILSQINKEYLQHLIDYTKILQQRNSVLKQAAEKGKPDEVLFEILTEQLSQKGEFIHAIRKEFLQSFLPVAQDYYKQIAGKDDEVTLVYESDLDKGNMKTLLANSRQKDFILQRTTIGTHRDDVTAKMAGATFKTEASQGQRKSLLFALKLAEWQTLKEAKGFTPILLLDDVFEKLDEQRMRNLLNWVCSDTDGQIFITDTHAERLAKALDAIEVKHGLIEL
ncbi:DNA replication/repair protein RecF [Chitinophagaceae bacterium LWZ2-11]